MAPLFPHPDNSPESWLRRLDRAAAAMNPFLTLLVIGLAALNLTVLALLASQLPITRGTPGVSPGLTLSADSPGAASRTTGDPRVWTLY